MTQTQKTRLSSLLSQLGEARKAAANAYGSYKELKSAEDQLRFELENELHAVGLKSAKGEDFSVSLAPHAKILVKHEQSVIEWLRETPDIESDVYIGLKPTQFQTLAKSILKNSGEIIPGTEVEHTEVLSIRSNKK